MRILYHLKKEKPRECSNYCTTALLRSLYAGQKTTVITSHGTRVVPNWESSKSRLYTVTCFFNFHAEFSSVQSFQISVIPWTAALQASLSIINSQSLLKPMSTESVMPANHVILCHLLLLSPSIFPSIRVFSNESLLCVRWPKYWSFSFRISLSNEYSRLDFLYDLFAVQGMDKSLLQHHSSKASILQCSAFFTVQLSHPYMTTGKTSFD